MGILLTIRTLYALHNPDLVSRTGVAVLLDLLTRHWSAINPLLI